MAGASTAPCKKTAWLKILLSIDGDSSDASPQHEPVPSKTKIVGKKRPSEEEVRNNNRINAVGNKRMVRQVNEGHARGKHGGQNNGDDRGLTAATHVLRRSRSKKRPGATHVVSSDSMGGGREERRQRKLEKADSFPPRRRPHSELEAAKKARDKEKVLELHQRDPSGMAKVKAAAARQRRMKKLRARRIATGEYDRLQAVKLKRQESFEVARLNRNQRVRMRRKAPAGAAAEATSNDEGAAGGHQAQLPSKEEAIVRKRGLERQHGVAIKAKSAVDYKKDRSQQRMQEALHALGVEFGSHGKPIPKRQKLEHKKGEPESAAGSGVARTKPLGPTKESQDRDSATSQVWFDQDAADTHFAQGSHNASESGSQEKPSKSREQCQDTSIIAEIKEEGEVDSPALLREAGKPQDIDEKAISAEKRDVLLDMTPIPRKATRDTTAAAFMIPKKSVKSTEEKVEARDGTLAGPRGAVGTYSPTTVLPPASSPQLSDREPIRLQRRRTKNPVPVKCFAVSTQDQALMRMARRRNSIFLAAAELAARPSLANGKMIGYEVRDGDGKVFPDLASRLDCATKHEMAEDKHSFANSFFGLSLAVPKAKGTSSLRAGEHGDTENRTLSCYEILRFGRPEDREFYQRRMYGATFVPQHLRGRATLIMRTARFERKSTGIRFNQDRDREEFAAALGKRYTFKKSEPRCEIPRENWQRITKAQGGAVYLHYNNLEDAERASYLFRDDAENPLELKREHKQRVSSSPRSSPSNGVGSRLTARRSCSSERSPAEPQSQSSQGDSTQRDRHRNVHRYSRYDRPPSAQREDGYGRYSREYRSRSRSRSHSRPEQFPGQQLGAVANRSGGGGRNEAVVTGSSAALSSAEHQGSSSTNGGDKNTRENAQTESRPLAPSLVSTCAITQDNGLTEQEVESGEEQEEGEIESSAVFIPGPARSKAGNRQQSNNERSYQRQESYHGRPQEQQYRRRSRSRSRPRSDGHWDGGRRDNGRDDSYAKKSGPKDFDGRRRTYYDEMDRHGGRDYHDEGYEDRRGEAYMHSRSYY